jgi:hypothetical protein
MEFTENPSGHETGFTGNPSGHETGSLRTHLRCHENGRLGRATMSLLLRSLKSRISTDY